MDTKAPSPTENSPGSVATPSAPPALPPPSPADNGLADRKLRLEVAKLELEAEKIKAETAQLKESDFLKPNTWVAVATALVAIVALVIQYSLSTANYQRAQAEAKQAEIAKLQAQADLAAVEGRRQAAEKSREEAERAAAKKQEEVKNAEARLRSAATLLAGSTGVDVMGVMARLGTQVFRLQNDSPDIVLVVIHSTEGPSFEALDAGFSLDFVTPPDVIRDAESRTRDPLPVTTFFIHKYLGGHRYTMANKGDLITSGTFTAPDDAQWRWHRGLMQADSRPTTQSNAQVVKWIQKLSFDGKTIKPVD